MRNSTKKEKNSRQEKRDKDFKSFSKGQKCSHINKRASEDTDKTSELVKTTQKSKVLIKSKRVTNIIKAI